MLLPAVTAGTIVYMPSELLLTGRMTPATDIYSFGLMSEWRWWRRCSDCIAVLAAAANNALPAWACSVHLLHHLH